MQYPIWETTKVLQNAAIEGKLSKVVQGLFLVQLFLHLYVDLQLSELKRKIRICLLEKEKGRNKGSLIFLSSKEGTRNFFI